MVSLDVQLTYERLVQTAWAQPAVMVVNEVAPGENSLTLGPRDSVLGADVLISASVMVESEAVRRRWSRRYCRSLLSLPFYEMRMRGSEMYRER